MAEWVFVLDADDDDAEDNIEDEETPPGGMHLCLCLNPFCKSWLPAFEWYLDQTFKNEEYLNDINVGLIHHVHVSIGCHVQLHGWTFQCLVESWTSQFLQISSRLMVVIAPSSLSFPMPYRIWSFPVPRDEIDHNWYWLWGNPQFSKVSSSSPQSPKSSSTVLNLFSHHHNPQDVHLWGAGGHKSPNIHARNTIQTSGYDHCWGPDEVGLRMVKIMMRALILMMMIT